MLNIKRQESRSDAQESIKITQIDSSTSVIIFVFGLVCGVLIMIFKEKINFKKEHKISIKDPKNLLVKLLEFKHDPQVEEIIDILEKNIYQNQNIEIDKKSVTEVLKKYKIN